MLPESTGEVEFWADVPKALYRNRKCDISLVIPIFDREQYITTAISKWDVTLLFDHRPLQMSGMEYFQD